MTPYDPPSWIRHLGFYHFFKKSQEATEINTKSSQNALEMYTFINFPNLMQKTGKNYRIQRQREGGRGERWGGGGEQEREREREGD